MSKGRPTLPAADRRDAILQSKVTASELEAFDQYRATLGADVTRSDALRALIVAAVKP